MKRSEMLALMYGKFTKEHTIKKASIYDALDKLLDYMIEQGMQPPPIYFNEDETTIVIYDWEYEDEAK